MEHNASIDVYEGKWYAHPPLRNALVAGLITGTAFVLAHIDRVIPHSVEIFFYLIAIFLGGYHWGREGTDAAIEAADVALMSDDITRVSYAIQLGKRANKIGLQNIVFSLLILVVLIPSALIGIMTVAIAVFFHEISELLAVANGLRVASRGV